MQVDRQQPRVVLQGDLFEAAETQDAGAVEQQAQAAIGTELRKRLADHVGLADVHGAVPGARQLRGQAAQRLGIDVQQTDPPAPAVEQTRAGGADSGSGTSDQDVLHLSPSALHSTTNAAASSNARSALANTPAWAWNTCQQPA
ncbi:Uncharacterised protein [Klebsiella pneumoniae]|nr:Uncharacterised protein [Klebsiella pneumoniae]